MGIAQGLQPLIGYHYGANKLERMKKLIIHNYSYYEYWRSI